MLKLFGGGSFSSKAEKINRKWLLFVVLHNLYEKDDRFEKHSEQLWRKAKEVHSRSDDFRHKFPGLGRRNMLQNSLHSVSDTKVGATST